MPGRNLSALAGSGKKWQPIGVNSAAAVPLAGAAGSTQTIKVQPPKGFAGRKIIIPSSVGQYFLVNFIKVANQPQIASGDPIHALSFAETVKDNDLEMDRVSPNGPIEVNVTNLDGAAHFFYMTIFGDQDDSGN